MLTNKQIDKRVLEAMKCMRNYITSLDNNLSNEIEAENHGNYGESGKRKYYRNYHTEFDQYTDELPFQNFHY